MSRRNDPDTGQFTKGNPGRPKGSKNERTRLWEELGEELTDRHAQRFTALLDRLWDSADMNENLKAADLFLKLAEYFRPKLQRVQHQPEGNALVPPIIVVDDIPQLPESWPGPVIRMLGKRSLGMDAAGEEPVKNRP